MSSKVAVAIQKPEREFLFNKINLRDPGPDMTPQQVKEFYAGTYPELTTAEIEGPEAVGTKTRYEFRKAVGTKGSGPKIWGFAGSSESIDLFVSAKFGAAGADLIRTERIRQISVEGEGWTADHDDEHDQHELAAAACAYAAPEPLYRVTQYPDGTVATADCWPQSWDEQWDKRLRGQSEMHPHHNLDELPFSADEYPIDQRIRNLTKAGALIAAEIDRLLRKKLRDGSGNA